MQGGVFVNLGYLLHKGRNLDYYYWTTDIWPFTTLINICLQKRMSSLIAELVKANMTIGQPLPTPKRCLKLDMIYGLVVIGRLSI